MQLTDMRKEVRQRCGLASTDSLANDAVLTDFVNSSIRMLSTMHDWPWLEVTETFNTVSGTSTYTPAAAWRMTQRVELDELDIMYRTPRAMVEPLSRAGLPAFYSIEEAKIVLAPVADQVYAVTHVYSAIETALSADGDEPLVYDWAIDLPIVMAAILLAGRLKDHSLAQLLEGQKRDILRNLHDEVRQSRASPVPKHRTDWYMR